MAPRPSSITDGSKLLRKLIDAIDTEIAHRGVANPLAARLVAVERVMESAPVTAAVQGIAQGPWSDIVTAIKQVFITRTKLAIAGRMDAEKDFNDAKKAADAAATKLQTANSDYAKLQQELALEIEWNILQKHAQDLICTMPLTNGPTSAESTLDRLKEALRASGKLLKESQKALVAGQATQTVAEQKVAKDKSDIDSKQDARDTQQALVNTKQKTVDLRQADYDAAVKPSAPTPAPAALKVLNDKVEEIKEALNTASNELAESKKRFDAAKDSEKDKLKADYAKAVKKVEELTDNLKTANSNLEAAKNPPAPKPDDVKIQAAKDALDLAKKGLADATIDLSKLDDVLKALKETQTNDTKAAADAVTAVKNAQNDLDKRLMDAQGGAGSTAVSDATALLDSAIDLVSKHPAIPSQIASGDTARTAKDVLDQLIASLRYQYVLTVQQNGKDSPTARNFQAALEAAYAQRAGMVYIRPASAFLRTSFPSSSLQEDAKLGWKNMLTEQEFRQLPFFDATYNNSKSKIVRELDKQYWQNVNQVRVAGGGDTNYVIAKDDVGNWYVKNYSADPKDIIRSARNLALFSLGSTFGGSPGDLLGTAAKQDLARNGTAGGLSAATQPPTLEKEFLSEDDKFSKATLQDDKDVLTAAKGLDGTIRNAWEKDTTLTKYKETLGKSLEGPKGTYLDKLPAEPTQPKQPTAGNKGASGTASANTPAPTPAEQIIDALQTMRRFHNALSPAIREALLAEPNKALKAAQDAKKQADDDLTALVKKTDTAQTAKDAAQKDFDAKAAAAAPADAKLTATQTAAGTAVTKDLTDAQAAAKPLDDAKAVSQKALDSASTALQAAKDDQKKGQDKVDAAVKAVTTAQADVDAANAAAATATREMSDLIRESIATFVKERQTVLERYQTAIEIIGDASGDASKASTPPAGSSSATP